jgi:hypothetical protein
MTLIIQKPTGAKLVMRKTWQPMDPDAAAYITAVETADGQALEEPTKIAIDNFVLGCKADGIWTAIKASCILAGARTLTGALIPLVGTAPTNNNFVSGDYNRKTGLVGDGSTKYLNSGRANNADPQNNNHNALYASTANSSNPAILMGDGNSTIAGKNRIVFAGGLNLHFDSRNAASTSTTVFDTNTTGFMGHSRNASATTSFRVAGNTTSYSTASVAPTATNVHVFSRELGGIPTNARLAFYSIGESLDLALLDARVTDLINAIGAAIP